MGCKYFMYAWNWMDLPLILTTALILIASVPQETMIEIDYLRPEAAIVSCLLLLKLYNWMRLFDSTAFYIKLVRVTLWDIRFFVILILTAVAAFGIPLIVLNLELSTDSQILREGQLFYRIINMLFAQYL